MNYLRHINRRDPRTLLFQGINCVQSFNRTAAKMSKPPNIYVYDGHDSESEVFKRMKSLIENNVQINTYTVYHLSETQFVNKPWSEHSLLLIMAECGLVRKSVQDRVLNYVNNLGGSLLSLQCSIDSKFLTRELLPTGYKNLTIQSTGQRIQTEGSEVYAASDVYNPVAVTNVDDKKLTVVAKVDGYAGKVLCSTVTFDEKNSSLFRDILSHLDLQLRTEANASPKLTPIFVFTNLNTNVKFSQFMDHLTTKMAAKSVPVDVTKCDQIDSAIGFNVTQYWSHLNTRCLGRCLLFSEVTDSTNDTLEEVMCNLPDGLEPVAVANCQVKGRGRSRNAWLSPKGSASFSFSLKVSLGTGHAIAFMQHIAALAIVQSVKKLTGCERLRIKWPNDIYDDSGHKIGGILVKSSVLGSDIFVVVGCGVNVANSKPTVCINSLLTESNQPLTIEQLIAGSLNEFEQLLADFQKNRDSFLRDYYSNWLHSDQIVRLRHEGKDEEATVVGLDECGYLLVKNKDGKMKSVHPDGNSFDMFHGLIYAKDM